MSLLPFIMSLSSNSVDNTQNKMSNNKYSFSIPTSNNNGRLNISLEVGKALFVLGANGVGKSTLMHGFFGQYPNQTKRIVAHRQTWFTNNAISITAAQKKQNEKNIKAIDRDIQSRWKGDYSGYKSDLTIFDLINSENISNKKIADAMREKRIDDAKKLSQFLSPINEINEILAISNIPIKIMLVGDDGLFASKNGCTPYSISELSDGERNALLICADVLITKPNQIIILDEPERHLHRSIISPLLSTLFHKKQDCAFIISTHDINLPTDHKESSTLLLRDCSWNGKSIKDWDADLITGTDSIPESVKYDILGSKRNILFVEGDDVNSLDRQIYELIYPEVTVIPEGNCSQVQKAVEGIKSTDNLHRVNAYGLIDADDRIEEDIQALSDRGIIALDCYSVESLYYHLEIVKIVAQRYAETVGIKENELFEKAISNIIKNITDDRDLLCSRLCEKKVRNSIMSKLPKHKEILEGKAIDMDLNLKAKEIFEKEKVKFDELVRTQNLNGLISRYPIKKTKVPGGIASGLGLKKDIYESAVRKLIIDDPKIKKFYRNHLLSKLTELMFQKEDKIDGIVVKEPTDDKNY